MINSKLEIPNHLKSYIVDQEYSEYTAIDHASWRFIMKISIDQKKPIGNSILTLFNKDQASGRYVKGKEAVKAVVEVLKIK